MILIIQETGQITDQWTDYWNMYLQYIHMAYKKILPI